MMKVLDGPKSTESKLHDIDTKLNKLLAVEDRLTAALADLDAARIRIADLEKALAERSSDSIDRIIESCKSKPTSPGSVMDEVPTAGSTRIRKSA